jgi:hypothetical protein
MDAEIAGAIQVLGYRPEFVEVLKRQAEAESEVCAAVFQLVGVQPKDEVGNWLPVRLPISLLLGWKLALRLATWELNGIRAHIEAGMPTADEVLKRLGAPQDYPDLDDFVRQHSATAIGVLHDSLLWSAGDCDLDIGVDLGIASAGDDELLDAMADLWQQMKANNQ